jgi:hypothetical protein
MPDGLSLGAKLHLLKRVMCPFYKRWFGELEYLCRIRFEKLESETV